MSARDCTTCTHNTYRDNPRAKDWVSCMHPVTLSKTPRPVPGDPAWVNWMTADMRVTDMLRLMAGDPDCPAWERAAIARAEDSHV